MSVAKPKVDEFLVKSRQLLRDQPEEVIEEFAEVLKRENMRQVKDQLTVELAPVLSRLTHIERQQERIIDLLKSQLNLDVYEKQIMDLLKKRLEEGK